MATVGEGGAPRPSETDGRGRPLRCAAHPTRPAVADWLPADRRQPRRGLCTRCYRALRARPARPDLGRLAGRTTGA